MNIEFPGPAIPAQDGGISYRAKVNGNIVACHFSLEALQDVDPSLSGEQAIEQFNASRDYLLSIAEKKIRAGQLSNSVVTIFTADVRP